MATQNESPDYHYLEKLNPQQREAVVYKSGPSLVIAGAGSGKTRVLTYKIIDLLQNGYEPYRILALTFTNKAAREMKSRIEQIVGEKTARRLKMGTFHSVFLRILSEHAELLGYKPGFTIYDTGDSKALVKMIIKDLGLDDKTYKPSSIFSIISNAKNNLKTASDYLEDSYFIKTDRHNHRPRTGEIFRLYEERCKISNAMDFDDILLNTYLLLENNPDIRRHYQDFFKYILIDEYQDTNYAQHAIVRQLAGDQQMICAVGDDSQSIYSFRGARIGNILSLEENFPGLKVFKLEQNYRSTKVITEGSLSLINKNKNKIQKNLYSNNEKGELIKVIKTYSDVEEAFIVANLINKAKLTCHDSYDDFAILYRTNAQSRLLEESLRKRSIAYRVYGGLTFYQRKEVKDMVAYFRMSINPDDDEALRRIINYPARGIGETTLKKLTALSTETKKSIWQVLTTEDLKEKGFQKGTVTKLSNFVSLIQEFIDDNAKGSNAYELGQLIFNRVGILNLLSEDRTPENVSRLENLYEIQRGLKEFVDQRLQTNDSDYDMKSFLSDVMLMTDQDMKESEDQPKVTLVTAHAAKGLEFKHVYIVGVENDFFPSALSKDTIESYEEERRLLYVAITRAKQYCTLTYATSRFRNGTPTMTQPSPFLLDIDPKYLDFEESKSISDSKPSGKFFGFSSPRTPSFERGDNDYKKPSPSYSSTGGKIENLEKIAGKLSGNGKIETHSLKDLREGTIIEHERFGKGTIIKIDNYSGDDSITVDFGIGGKKKLLLKFAKFKIIHK